MTTQDRSSWANFRSVPIDGRATFTIDASSTTTNWASASRASASHFLSCGRAWGDTWGNSSEGTEVEREFRFRFGTIRNLDSGCKCGYPHFMTSRRGPSSPSTRLCGQAAAGGRPAQSRAHPQGRPRRVRQRGDRRADRRRGQAGQGRRGHGLPPLPDQGGPARRARARALLRDRAVRQGGAAPRGRRGRASASSSGAAPSATPRTAPSATPSPSPTARRSSPRPGSAT